MPSDKKSKKEKVVSPPESEDEEPVSSEEETKKSKKKDKKDKEEKKGKKEKVVSPPESEDEEPASSEEETKKSKKKDKKDKEEKKDKKDKKEKKKKKEPIPVACVVLDVKSVPKKDNLKILSVGLGAAFGIDKVDIVTNAANVTKGKKYVCALPGVKVRMAGDMKVVELRKVGGVESCGMLCGPGELGWETDVLPDDQAVLLPDDAEPGEAIPSYEDCVKAYQAANPAKEEKADDDGGSAKKDDKKKKKGAAKSAQKADADEDFEAALAEAGGGGGDTKVDSKTKKKAAKKDADDDFEAALAEAGGGAPIQAEQAKADPKAKKKAAKKGADDDFEAALAEAGGGAPTEAEQAKADPKETKKAAKKGADDDFEAALAEAGGGAPEQAKVEEPAAEQPAASSSPAQEAPEDTEVDAKTLANRRKKEKDKQKKMQMQKQSAGGMWAEDENDQNKDVPDKDMPEKIPDKAEKDKKGGAKKPVNAAVAARAKEAEERRKLQEEKEAFEQSEQERIARETAEIEAELAAQQAARDERMRKRQEKIAQAKADGTYATKKEKERIARAAQLKAQFGFDADAPLEDEEQAPKGKAKAASTKKKKQQKKVEDEDEAAPVVEEQKTDAVAQVADDDDDNWEKAMDAEKIPKNGANQDNDGEDEDGEEEDDDDDSDGFMGYRSPIVCIMGHVDTGKTKLLDKIRHTNVQDGEAGGITQQIGATFFPDIALAEQTTKVEADFELEVPGLMIIDTPGHESFNNLRTRGSSLCDIAILVIDIMHGLEPQTVESLELLKKRRCPFIIAMNKVDRLHGWRDENYTSIQSAFDRQEDQTKAEFRKRYDDICLSLSERGLNCYLYWENEDLAKYVSIVPTSAITGEGVPDLLYMILNICQTIMPDKLEVVEDLECTVIEVKNIEGLGTTIDVVLKNGTLREGDQIVIAGVGGPIVTTIRALVTPQPMKEMRVKADYVHHKMINTSMGVKICAPDLENALAGSELLVVGPDDDIEELKEEVDENLSGGLNDFEKATEGVYVKASTLGSLEALLAFLQEMKIPVFSWGIGEVHKMDVKRTMIMKEKKCPEYAIILAFDVKVNPEGQALADKEGVPIFTADIIYHLQERFNEYMKKINDQKKTEAKDEAVFPVILKIDKQCVFHKTTPLIVGCDILDGQLRIGTPICVPDKDFLEIGRVVSIERDKKPVTQAPWPRKGAKVCIKIEQNSSQTHITYGRHFDEKSQLFSKVSRSSIDSLKDLFKDEMKKEDWALIIGMKKIFNIQ